jgi:hypothetical protein
LSALESQIEALRAAMQLSEEHTLEPAQHVADITEDMQAFVAAWEMLHIRAGLQADTFDG